MSVLKGRFYILFMHCCLIRLKNLITVFFSTIKERLKVNIKIFKIEFEIKIGDAAKIVKQIYLFTDVHFNYGQLIWKKILQVGLTAEHKKIRYLRFSEVFYTFFYVKFKEDEKNSMCFKK